MNDLGLDKQFDQSLCRLLAHQLQAAGALGHAGDSLAAWAAERGLPAFHAYWLAGSMETLAAAGYLSLEQGRYRPGPAWTGVQDAWQAWEATRQVFLDQSQYQAKAVLAEKALAALPAILAGATQATDVMFPHSSMALVENVYKNNDQADFYNGVVASTVARRVRETIGADPGRRVRILEIGAGTGGTTGMVLEQLAGMAGQIEEYCYTDLSKAFLRHAERSLAARYPFIECRIFDVESAPQAQGLSGGSYDIVLATNVLHATRDIRIALRNAKATLAPRGLIVINELSAHSLFAHVTFGLLEGWWRYEDAALRIPGCPGLSPETWRSVLAQEGFRPIDLPAGQHAYPGQQVMAAESDGVVRRRQGAPAPAAVSAAAPAEPAATAAPGALTEAGLKEIIRGQVSACLDIAREEVADRKSFADFGLDSITAGQLVHAINTALRLSLKTIELFEHSSVKLLTDYLLSKHGRTLTAPVSASAPAAAALPGPAANRIRAVVKEQFCACLCLGHEEVGKTVAFADYGLDSITAGQFTQLLNGALDIELKTTDLFQHSSVEQLSQHILARFPRAAAQHGGGPAPAETVPGSAAAQPAPAVASGEGIAVVGASGKFARSDDLDALWAHLAQGTDLVGSVTRWNLAPYFADKADYCKQGSFLDDIDKFDPAFFNISGTEACWMDPQQRVFLEQCWKALEDAGYAGAAMQGKNCGVYVGCGAPDYRHLFGEHPPAQAMWGNASSVIPARIAYYLDLQGPAISVDTACSSSLVAIHLACQALLTGDIDHALAGGVSIQCTPDLYTTASRADMLSARGRCHSFDERADGFVPGEGVGVLLLRRLSDALAAGDHIHAVIRASGANQDGASNGITAPSAKAQERLECAVYEKSRVHPGQIQMVEAHGTGTRLGDPIEFDALTRSFRKHTQKKQFCALGSIKSNLGHTTAAAGVAGLMKILLSLKHKQIAPSIHFENGNSHIDFDDSPFYVNTALRDWTVAPHEKRMAALSSFGFSGTNVHMLVEEAPVVARTPGSARPGYLIALSAETPQQLLQQATQLAAHCRRHPALDCADVSATLLTGRRHLRHRLACIVASCAELAALLEAWLEERTAQHLWVGEVDEYAVQEQAATRAQAAACIANCAAPRALARYLDDLRLIAECYMQGYELDFTALFADGSYRRTPLPTYPFARESYWIPDAGLRSRGTPGPTAPPGRLHALVHAEVPMGGQPCYSSRFDGTEFFLRDHVIGGRKLLPGVAYLEMARAAAQAAAAAHAEGTQAFRLHNIVWGRPLVVGDAPVTAQIRLHAREAGRTAYEIAGPAQEHEAELIYSSGWIETVPAGARPQLRIDALQRACAQQRFSAEQVYAGFSSLGIDYGPGHRAIVELCLGSGQILAKLALPAAIAASLGEYVLHPALLDAALQATIGFGLGAGELRAALPFSIEEVRSLAPCEALMWVHVTRTEPAGQAPGLERFDLQLLDDAGALCVELRGFTARAQIPDPAEGALPASGTLLLRPVWGEAAVPAAQASRPAGRHLVLVCELDGLPADALQAELDRAQTRLPGSACRSLGGSDATVSQRFASCAAGLMADIQALFAGRSEGDTVLQCLIPNAGEGRLFAGLAGMLKTARLENPALLAQLIEVDPAIGAAEAAAIVRRERDDGARPWVRYHGSRRSVCSWEEFDAAPQPDRIGWKEGGVYLITGGAGGLGRIMAEEICRNAKAPTVVLAGRSPLDADTAAALAQLERTGARVVYRQADVARELDVLRLMQFVRTGYGRLDGIIHAAGVIRDSLIARKTPAELALVLAPKVEGVIHLDEASRDFALDFFILFSAGAAVFGNPGQADYAAANGFLDAFALYRGDLAASGQRPGRTLSINWPLWQDGGMRVDAATERAMEERAGAVAMPARDGIAALHRAFASAHPQVLVVQGDWARLRTALQAGAGRAPRRAASTPQPLPAVDARDLDEAALAHLKQVLTAVVGTPEARIHADAPMEKYGIDSLMIMQLTTELEKTFGPLSKTLFFEHRSLRELAAYLAGAHAGPLRMIAGASQAPAAAAADADALPPVQPAPAQLHPPGRPDRAMDIAIVGLAGRYPQADDLDQFWTNLREGKDCITEIPAERWDHRPYFDENKNLDGKTYSKWGGFIRGVDQFDPLFFNISPREAELMDPQERLFLQCAHEVLEDAGYTRDTLAAQAGTGAPVGVFVGVMYEEYQLYGAQRGAMGNPIALTGSPSSIANRVSYFYDFQGPSMAVDTMCSSSLTALHLACESIRRGECEMAIAGGVNLSVHPNKYLMLAQGSFASTKGRCESFGAGGDGYVPGEGVGALMLKPTWKAERDGDHIYGIVRATAINHGGKTNSYSVPSPNAQSSVIHTALRAAGIDPRTISYIEAHGTGTALGDPIEVAGLTRAFREFTDDKQFCAIGSVKSNIGHCESAAGISGITKVLLQMQHRELAPSLHAAVSNPYIDFDNSPFIVQKEHAQWKRPVLERDGVRIEYPRIAGISSFGAGGANAHAIIEEYAAPAASVAPAEPAAGGVAIVLSARNEERLLAGAARLLAALPAFRESKRSLSDMAYTLQVGREAMEARLALVADSVDTLESALAGLLAGQTVDGLHRGKVQRDDAALASFSDDTDLAGTLDKWLVQRRFEKLLPLWVKGLDLDWARLYAGRRPGRVSLPAYAFEARRYWVPDMDPAAPGRAPAQVLHPLLHRNVSTFAEQCFSSVFDGQEVFLKDHVVHGHATLPAVAYLEMAHAAMLVASAGTAPGPGICLKDVVWAQPLVAGASPLEVRIRLTPQADGEAGFEVFSAHRSGRILHSQGRLGTADSAAVPAVSLSALRQACRTDAFDARTLYDSFEKMGIKYGPGHRAVQALWSGPDQVMATLSLPPAVFQSAAGCVLHPGMVDAALQASLGLVLGPAASATAAPALVPFSIERVEVFGPCTPDMVAVVRFSPGRDGAAVRIIDADLYDSEGRLRVRMRGLSSRVMQPEQAGQESTPAQPSGPAATLPAEQRQDGTGASHLVSMLAPCWERTALPAGAPFPAPSQHVLVIGGTHEQQDLISRQYRHTHVMRLDRDEDVESIAMKLGNLPAIDHVFWIAPDSDPGLSQTEAFIEDQERGVLQCFRIAKALLLGGYGDRVLGWTFITVQTLPVHPADHVRPSFAAVCGFGGALAKERPDWHIRLLDLESHDDWPLTDLFQVPADRNGDAWARRGTLWYRQVLMPSVPGAGAPQLYREGGVYVVIGGAGGIGESWSEWMMRNFNARIVWIGRKAPDAAIGAKIDRLARFGVAPVYIPADASDGAALAAAHAQIKERYGQIHGIVHSAIVLSDRSVAKMSEGQFRSGLNPKVNISVQMARVFRNEPLDFVMFFSSMISFSKAAGQSNYAAGCTFKDAFARRLGAEWPCAVKIMNWGFWGSVGAVASPDYQARMEKLGVGSLQPQESMEALSALLNGSLDQLALIKTTRSLQMEGVDMGAFFGEAHATRPSLIKRVRDYAYTRPQRSRAALGSQSATASQHDAIGQSSQLLNTNADYVE